MKVSKNDIFIWVDKSKNNDLSKMIIRATVEREKLTAIEANGNNVRLILSNSSHVLEGVTQLDCLCNFRNRIAEHS